MYTAEDLTKVAGLDMATNQKNDAEASSEDAFALTSGGIAASEGMRAEVDRTKHYSQQVGVAARATGLRSSGRLRNRAE